MIETKKAHELDVVELTVDLQEFGLRRGERGTVVEAFDDPEEAYMLEFVDESGATSRLAYGVKPDQIKNIGNDLLDKPQYEQKESRKQRVTADSNRTYIVALLFAFIFIASTTILLGGVRGVFHPTSDTLTWVTVFTAIVSAIGIISTTILAWRNDRRVARENELKIAQLERELEVVREKPVPTNSENRK